MNVTQSTVLVSDIPAIVADPNRGIVSLVGDRGGLSRITGDLSESAVVLGALAVETEHGTIYLDPESETRISEEIPLDAGHEWVIAWSVDACGSSPEHAAATVWRETFGRDTAGSEDACTFTVTDPETGQAVDVDLSEFDLGSLIE
jgi:hypothetical protein